MKKYLYLPVEIYKREMPAKLILALRATKKGYSVVIGRQYLVEKIALENSAGVYLGTTVVEAKKEFYSKLKEKGSFIIAQDEEGLVYYNKANFLKHRVVPEVLRNVDIFLTWGKHHQDIVCEKYFGDNIKILGNIRFEMLKEKYYCFYKNEVETIRKKYGKFILINTNLAAYNHIISPETNINNIAKQGIFNDEDNEFYHDKVIHQERIMKAILEFVKEIILVLPQDYLVVIRPHPAEKILSWGESSERIKVIQEGSVIPWIYAAECVIQQNCTTAIEATLLNRKVFSFIPCYDERYDGSFINKVSEVHTSVSDLVNAILDYIENRTINDNGKYIEMLDQYVNNIHENDDAMEQLLAIISNETIYAKRKIETCSQFIFDLKRNILGRIFRKEKQNNSDNTCRSAKFLKFDKEDITECISKLKEMDRINYKNTQIKNICKDVILLERK